MFVTTKDLYLLVVILIIIIYKIDKQQRVTTIKGYFGVVNVVHARQSNIAYKS